MRPAGAGRTVDGGYARCSHLTQELRTQLDALAATGIPADKVFAENVSTRVRVRPKFEEAIDTCRWIKAHAPHYRVILTVYEMKSLGRDSAELTVGRPPHRARHRAGDAGRPLTGICDPSVSGRMLFAFSSRWPRPNARASARPRWKGSTPPPARATTAACPR